MPVAKPLLLIVDDDSLISESLSFAFAQEYDVLTSHSRSHARSLVRQLRNPPRLALVDLGLPPCAHRPDEGFALISELAASSPQTKIVALSGQNDADNARHARTLGAVDFVAKPCPPETLLPLLHRALRYRSLDAAPTAEALIGNSPALHKLRTQLQQYADSPFPVLIEGESGSGKEIVARNGLHFATARRKHPFLALNCAAIAPSLVEATLFGHAKGAFTGASAARAGYFEEAGDGTLFLDEIGELPLSLQAKLLRALQQGEIQRVGADEIIRVDVRLIAATNRDLLREVEAGRFRSEIGRASCRERVSSPV